MSQDPVIIIPARYPSVRFPGKPLAGLTGATGKKKSLLARSIEAAKGVSGISMVYVATDDDRIADEAKRNNCPFIMTSQNCQNGTERVAEAAQKLGLIDNLVINLQGDAPLTPAWFVSALIEAMSADPTINMATPILRCDQKALANFKEDRKKGLVGGTTAVVKSNGDALYFSKEVLPYADKLSGGADEVPVFHHVGVYGYKPAALRRYMDLPVGPLEKTEGLEQLRFLENDIPVRCVEVPARGAEFWEVNVPEDVDRVNILLAQAGLE